jgi:hypothetical protein
MQLFQDWMMGNERIYMDAEEVRGPACTCH